MIFKNSSPFSPTVTMTIDNVPVDYMSLQRLTIEQNENMHSLAIIEFAGLDPSLIHRYLEAPLTISVSVRDRNPCSFTGYVVFLEPFQDASLGVVNGSPFQFTRAYCFGASYKMKSLKSTVHENKTLSDIAKEIADTYQFSVSVPNDSYRFPRLVQPAQSDWSFLIQTANRLGYNVMVEGTHLHIWDPFKSMTRYRTHTILYTLRGTKGSPTPIPGQILRFDGRIGVVSPSGARTPDTIHSLDKNGNIISVSNKDSNTSSGLGTSIQSSFTNVLNINADSYEMAERLVSGTLRRKFPMTAYLEVVAEPSITPGKIIKINEYNSQFDGFWYVRGVRHEIAQSNMVTYLDIARDSLDGAQKQTMTSDFYKTPPKPALINKKWVSSQDMVNVYN